MPKDKLKKLSGSFVNGKEVPSMITTDPNVVTPEIIAGIKSAMDRARKEIRGAEQTNIKSTGKPVKTSLEAAPTKRREKRQPVPSVVKNRAAKPAGKGIKTVPDAVVSGGRVRSTKINMPNEKMPSLTALQRKSLSMERQRLNAIGEVAEENEYYNVMAEAMNKKQLVEPEQNRMRAL